MIRTLSYHLLLALFLFLPSLLFVEIAHAQAVISSASLRGVLHINIDPQYPRPGETVQLTVVGDPLIDLVNSTITWSKDGKILAQGIGKTKTSFTAGTLGTESVIQVQVTDPDGTDLSTSVSIIPTRLDLLIDSDSYTPPFYRGRAMPSAETQMQLRAIASFRRPDGSSVPPSSIIYTWRRDGVSLGSVSGRGRQTVSIPAPGLYDSDTIEVTAVSADNAFSSSASIRIPATEPILSLYEDHPLFGLMYHRAMGKNTSISDSETTFAAVLYYSQIKDPADPRLRYTWTVNGERIPANTARPHEITINADDSQGEARIELSISHATNFSMKPTGQWNTFFKNTGQVNNPFSSGF